MIPFAVENNPDATITGLPVYQMMTFLTWLTPQIIAVAVYQNLVGLNSTTFSKRLMNLNGLKGWVLRGRLGGRRGERGCRLGNATRLTSFEFTYIASVNFHHSYKNDS